MPCPDHVDVPDWEAACCCVREAIEEAHAYDLKAFQKRFSITLEEELDDIAKEFGYNGSGELLRQMSEVVRLVELGDGDMMVMSSEFKVSSLTLGTAKKLEKTILAIMQAERTLHADQCNAMSLHSLFEQLQSTEQAVVKLLGQRKEHLLAFIQEELSEKIGVKRILRGGPGRWYPQMHVFLKNGSSAGSCWCSCRDHVSNVSDG
ncbi:hypothetical protein AAVH_03427 [Aphelenchoides avenae]|nr:hypothetical protein AAVH_03427 [Aphelenchus avenae]